MDESGFITAYGGGGTSFADIVAYVISILNSIVFVLASLALLLFLWGVFKYVYTAGAKKDRKAILWSLIALFVLFSIWGILRIACDSLLSGACGTGTPLNIVSSSYTSGGGGPSTGTPGGTGGIY